MKNEHEQKPLLVPLFDTLPHDLNMYYDSIVTTFDGTIKENGVEIILTPNRGEIIRANLYNLHGGRVTSYVPLARGRWCSYTRDLNELDYEYQKLDRISEEVKLQYNDWKNNDRHTHLREWSNARVKRAVLGMNLVIMPWEWHDNHVSKNANSIIKEVQLDLEERPTVTDDIGKRLLEDKEFQSKFLKDNPPQRGLKPSVKA